MIERRELNIEKLRYLKLENLVDVKLPEDIKRKVANLVFEGKLSNKVVQLSVEDFSTTNGMKFIQKNIPDFYEVCESLAAHFEKNVMDVLLKKSTELLEPKKIQADEQKIQDIMKWYEEIKKEAQEMYKRWLGEVAVLAIGYEKFNTSEEPTTFM